MHEGHERHEERPISLFFSVPFVPFVIFAPLRSKKGLSVIKPCDEGRNLQTN
jgi:hypothetical protein